MVDTSLVVTETTFTQASERDEARGLLGYLAIVLNESIRADGLTLRRTEGGELYVAFPARTDRAGMRHALLRPLDEEHRRALQAQVFAQLGIGEALP